METLLDSLEDFIKVCIGLGVNEYKSGNFEAGFDFIQKTLEPLMTIVDYCRVPYAPVWYAEEYNWMEIFDCQIPKASQGISFIENLMEAYFKTIWNMFSDKASDRGSKKSALNAFKHAFVGGRTERSRSPDPARKAIITCFHEIAKENWKIKPDQAISHYHIIISLIKKTVLDYDLKEIFRNTIDTLMALANMSTKIVPILIDLAEDWKGRTDLDGLVEGYYFSEKLYKLETNSHSWNRMWYFINCIILSVSEEAKFWSRICEVERENIDLAVRCCDSCFSDENLLKHENQYRFLKKKTHCVLKLSLIYTRVGKLEEKQTNYENAIVAYQKSFIFLKEMLKLVYKRRTLISNINRGNKIAVLYNQNVRNRDAINWYKTVLEMSREFAERSQYSTDSQRISAEILIDLYRLTESEEERKAYYEEVLEISNIMEVPEIEKEISRKNNTYYLKTLSYIYNCVGELVEKDGKFDNAITTYQKRYEILERILKFDDGRRFLRASINCGNKLATLNKKIGRDREAVEWYNISLERSREFAEQSRFSTDSQRLTAEILINLYELTESKEERKAYYEEALDITHRLEQSEIEKQSLEQLREFFRSRENDK